MTYEERLQVAEKKLGITDEQYANIGKWLVRALVLDEVAKDDDPDVIDSPTIFIDAELCDDHNPSFPYICLDAIEKEIGNSVLYSE